MVPSIRRPVDPLSATASFESHRVVPKSVSYASLLVWSANTPRSLTGGRQRHVRLANGPAIRHNWALRGTEPNEQAPGPTTIGTTLRAFWKELRRRNVIKVGAAYAVIAWLLIQAVAIVVPTFEAPQWVAQTLTFLLILGFPFAVGLAWAFEVTPEGVHRTRPTAAASLPEAGADGPKAPAAIGPATAAASAPVESRPTPALKPKVKFCRASDGAKIAYATMGAGPPLIKTANWLSHIELDAGTPVYGHVIRDLAARFELTLYDERLSGLSDWKAGDVSLDAFVEDLEAVRRAAGLARFSILAFSQGCAVSVAYAARYPARVDRMVLFGGFARNFRTGEGEVEAIATLIESGWGRDNPAFRQIFTTSLLPGATKEELDSLNELMRLSATPENAARLFRAIHAIDVRALAAKVQAPTLVFHSRDESGVPFEVGRELAALIPGARFVGLPGRNHLLLERDEAYAIFKDEVCSFLAGEA